MATVTSKGQITIPRKVRDALGLVPGSRVEITIEEGQAILRKEVRAEDLERWQGRLRGKLLGDTVDQTIELLRGERDIDGDPQ